MAGLCKGVNEPPGSLKDSSSLVLETEHILLLNVFSYLKCNFTTLDYVISTDIHYNLSLMRNVTLCTTLKLFFAVVM